MAVHKISGLPLVPGIEKVTDLPHTLTYALLYRSRIDSFNELPKDKRPPRNLWDKPYALGQFLDTIWDKDTKPQQKESGFVYDLEEVE